MGQNIEIVFIELLNKKDFVFVKSIVVSSNILKNISESFFYQVASILKTKNNFAANLGYSFVFYVFFFYFYLPSVISSTTVFSPKHWLNFQGNAPTLSSVSIGVTSGLDSIVSIVSKKRLVEMHFKCIFGEFEEKENEKTGSWKKLFL